jgi:hypothetical protein
VITTDVREKFYATEQLGPKRERTPEGFLLCRDVPIGRVGVQMYGPGETPVKVGPDGIAWVDRTAEEVFRPETIASANGKSLVNEHPESDVDPANWKELTDGIMLYPRQGTGEQEGLLLADILVCDHKAIGLVDDGKVELSLGYTCDYEQTGEGRGAQSNIVINHVALVEKGRCGSRCSIGDKAFGGNTVAKTLKERITAAFKTGDQATLTKILSKVKDADLADEDINDLDGDGDTHIHVHAPESPIKKWTDDDLDEMDQRLAKLEESKASQDAKAKDETAEEKKEREEKAEDAKRVKDESEEEERKREEKKTEDELEEEAPEGTGDMARKAKDSAYLVEPFQEAISLAEIIHPGIQVPTIDAKLDPKKTYDSLCRFRRSVLTVANSTADGAGVIKEVNGGRAVTADGMSKLTCDRARFLFNGVGAAMKLKNTTDRVAAGASTEGSKPLTIADVNKANSDFWAKER